MMHEDHSTASLNVTTVETDKCIPVHLDLGSAVTMMHYSETKKLVLPPKAFYKNNRIDKFSIGGKNIYSSDILKEHVKTLDKYDTASFREYFNNAIVIEHYRTYSISSLLGHLLRSKYVKETAVANTWNSLLTNTSELFLRDIYNSSQVAFECGSLFTTD